MEYSHPDVAIQAAPLTLRENSRESAIKKVFASDPALAAQLFMLLPLAAAGIVFQITAIQWFLVLLVSFISLVCGVFRAAAILQSKRDVRLSDFHINRIKTMGNSLVAISAGISFLTYLLVFIPAILKTF